MNEDTRPLFDTLPVVDYDETSEQFVERIVKLVDDRMRKLQEQHHDG